jgi:long-subunit fatty acid transport protein
MLRVILIVLLLLAATAAGQDLNLYGFSTVDHSSPGSGARALGMGGAFTGVADDASALTWNPAGLIQVDKTQASAAGSYFVLKQKTTRKYLTGSAGDFSATEDDNKLKLSYASFVAPLRIKGHPFMTSATYRSAMESLEDWYSWSTLDQFYVSSTRDTVFYNPTRSTHTTITGGVDIFSFGFGTGLYGDLAIGGSVNIYSGSGEANYYNNYLDTVVTEFAGVADSIQLIRAQRVDDVINIKGYNFVGSLFFERDMFRVGVKVETPYELIYEHDLARHDTLYENGLPTFPIGDRGLLYRGKTKLEMPWVVSGGASVTPTSNLVLSGDVEVRRFSDAPYSVERNQNDTLFIPDGSVYYPYHCEADTCSYSAFNSSGEREEVYDEFDLGMRNSFQIRVGAEYTLKTSLGAIPIRAGGSVAKMQYTDVSNIRRDELDQVQRGFKLGDRVTRTSFSFGSGIHWRQIWLDFAAIWSSEEQKETGSDSRGSYEVTRKRDLPSVTFNFTGFF